MNVTIYSTTTCGFCHVLYSWLDENKVSYTKVLTDEDPNGMADFLAVSDGMLGVPFTVVTDDSGNETKISGLDRPKFKQALGI